MGGERESMQEIGVHTWKHGGEWGVGEVGKHGRRVVRKHGGEWGSYIIAGNFCMNYPFKKFVLHRQKFGSLIFGWCSAIRNIPKFPSTGHVT